MKCCLFMAADGTMTDGFVCTAQTTSVCALARLNWKKQLTQKKGLYTMSEDRVWYMDSSGDRGNECDMSNEIDRLTSRHIAKLLVRLGTTIPPVVEQEIKRQFRFLSDDIKSVIGENNDEDEDRFNR